MAVTQTTRKLMKGFEAVRFEGCDLDDEGRAVPATADNIEKWWAPTEKEALDKL